jgi:uncharacterized damage-inducible protein DinB
MSTPAVREHVARVLAWEEAHSGLDSALADLPPELRGEKPDGLPYSPWQLLEHIRIAQHDILDFCRNSDYAELDWPDDYWPSSATPPDPKSWDASIQAFQRDREALQDLTNDATIDLTSRIPHGSGQTYLRELLLVADHTAYHVGELIVVRRLLGSWPPSGKRKP